jgi:signal transduction histidine kinase
VANERRRIAATGLAVVAVTAPLVAGLHLAEERGARARLDATADALAGSIEGDLDRFAELGTAINAGLAPRDEVDTAGYEALLEELEVTRRYPSLLGASRVVSVPRHRLDEVVVRQQVDDPHFRVHGDAGEDELRLILQVHPREPNADAIGLDVAGRPDTVVASERARVEQAPALSSVTQLVQLPPGEAGAVLYVPKVEDGRVDSWIGLSFAGDAFLDQLQPLPAPVAARVIDPDAVPPRTLGELGSAPEGEARRAVIERFGEQWLLEIRPGPGFADPWVRRASILVAIGGVVVAVLLSLLVRALSSRERRAEAIAERRTQQLAAANADLARLNVELSEANTDKDAFLAAVSHELRTPLTVIGGFAGSLRRMRDDPELRIFLDPIERNVRRLDGLVSDLLTLASLDAGGVAALPESVDLAAMARSAPYELAGVPGDQVRVEAPEPVIVRADRRHLERILTNLLVNAVQHGAPPIELGVALDGADAVLTVRDHGAGIDPALVAQMFGRFVRGPRTDRVAGTGLGLAIIRELTELNGGTARYRAAGPGASFEVRLPAEDQTMIDVTDVVGGQVVGPGFPEAGRAAPEAG